MSDKVDAFLIDLKKTVKQAMRQMSDVGEKELFVVTNGHQLVGSLSDGDIRHWILKGGSLEAAVEEVCNKSPRTVSHDFKIEDVRELMLSLKIESVPIIDTKGQVHAVLTWDEVFAGKQPKYREALTVPVVIMAGGKGSRLDPFTTILPKPLIPIGDKTIIELIMGKFKEYGVKEFFISVYHKARMIKSYFEEQGSDTLLHYIEEQKPLGTAGALKLLKNKIQGTFLVTNCDVIINTDYAELVKFHQQHSYGLTLVVSCRHYVIPYGVCELQQGGLVKTIKEKPEYDFLISTGMYVMDTSLLDLIPDGEVFDMIALINKARAAGIPVGGFPIHEHAWADIGQWEEYQKAVAKLRTI